MSNLLLMYCFYFMPMMNELKEVQISLSHSNSFINHSYNQNNVNLFLRSANNSLNTHYVHKIDRGRGMWRQVRVMVFTIDFVSLVRG